ncbi:MAG: molybdopterin-dependent oxidoreductase [Actinomycetota bacterium]|nr:molybdopterin-dependent oxidoreductase [Actinomycetota bacterium]
MRLEPAAARRTNLGLLALVPAAMATGAVAYAIGTRWATWAVVAHGAVGIGVVALVPWKSAVAGPALRRRRAGYASSLGLAALVVVGLVTGFLHVTGVRRLGFGLTSMQVHVGASLLALPLFVLHAVARPVPVRRADPGRRDLLGAAALGAGALLGWGAVEGVLRLGGLPGARRRFTGSHERGSGQPSAMPVTQWLDDDVPALDADTWRLAVTTADGDRRLRYADVVVGDDRRVATIDCTGGWYAEQTWEGVPLAALVGPTAGARSVLVRSVTGYSRRFPVADIPHLLLATRVAGEPLSPGHGFPARLVAPGRRGFWWVKWVTAVELSDRPWWWQSPFPLT